jgi:hypothetical protein
MSEATHITETTQEQTMPTDQPTEQAAAVQQEAERAALQAALEQEQAKEQVRSEAADTLKATVRAYVKGEKAYCAGLLEAGRLADHYLHQRMSLGDKRSAAVQTLEGQLAMHSSTPVDANRLVACHHAARLLCVGEDTKPGDIAYGHYRDHYGRLVERLHKDTPEECWVLLPGLEAECRALYAKAVADKLGREAVGEQVRALVRRHADAQKAAAEERAKQAAAEEEKAAQERTATVEAAMAAHDQEQQARKAAQEAQDDSERARMTAIAEEAKAAKLAAQKAVAEAHAKAEQAKKDREAAERQAAIRAAQEAKAAARAVQQAQAAEQQSRKPAATSPAKGTTVTGNLLASAKAGTAKDVAAMAAELVTGAEAPDDVLHILLGMLKDSGELSKRAKRACEAALVVLTRPDKPKLTTAPSCNGTPELASSVA